MSGYVTRLSCTDFDAFAVRTRQWDLDVRQLDCGEFRGEMLQFGEQDAHICEARFGRTLLQTGAPMEGCRTVGMPASPSTRFLWRGRQITGDSLVIFPRSSELSAVSDPSFHAFTCAFSEELLASIAESLSVSELDDLRGPNEAIRCHPRAMAELRASLKTLCSQVRKSDVTVNDVGLIDVMRRDLPSRILGAIAQATGTCLPATTEKRERALDRAVAYIDRYAGKPIRIGDICGAADVSQRTLEYAFVERFGITPKEFLLSYRLNQVHRALRLASPKTARVTDIAGRWQFSHLGQFAADYRKKFDELPSQTLRRPPSATQHASHEDE